MSDPRSGHVLVRQGKAASVTQPKWFKITVATVLATNRWVYTGVEQEAIDRAWQTLDDGGETVTKLYNAIEANNDGTGIQGHGVDIDGADYPAGFAVMPIAVGAVVRASPATVTNLDTDDPEVQWWFSEINADDGTCATGALPISLGGTGATTKPSCWKPVHVSSRATIRWSGHTGRESSSD